MKTKSPSKSKLQNFGLFHNPRLRKVSLVTILTILILGVAGGYMVFRNGSGERIYFTVVLDCGSTGSRVNVYEWRSRSGSDGKGDLPVLLHSYPDNVNKSNGCAYHCMQTEPGLHNFVNNGFRVRTAIEPLIRYAEQWVPRERHYETPIYVLATAGMRSLAAVDAERVLGDVENVVKEHRFLYRKSWIRVLSGKEEAHYGWVALNYRMGGFGSSLESSTLGLLDLGGSSLQVVAEVDGSVQDEHVFRSKIGPVEHDIVAYSLPVFGLNEAFDRTVAMLSHTQVLRESNDGSFEVQHPCLSSGFVQNYTCRGCFDTDSSDSRTLSNQENSLNSVILVGDANWEYCKVIARAAAINSTDSARLNQVHYSKCVGLSSDGGNAELNLTETSSEVTRYHALSGFFAVNNALNLSRRANLSNLWESGKKLCSNSWTDQTSINRQHCFRVPYMTSLIENALCLSDVEIVFGPGDVSWTLGASLIEGAFLWHPDERSQDIIVALKDNENISSLVITFILLVFLLLIVICCEIKLPMPSSRSAATGSLLPSYLCFKR